MPENLLIEALDHSHVDQCIPLWEEEDMVHEIDFRKRLIRAVNRTSDLSCIATVDGRAVGCVLALFTEFSVYAHRLVVHPDFRSRGIGRSIMKHLENEARHLGANAVILNAEEEPGSWFESLGYRRTEATFFYKNLHS